MIFMSNKRSYILSLINLRIIWIFKLSVCLSLSGVAAEERRFNITPFILYEQAPERIVIDGVSTRYGLGVLGGEAKLYSSSKFESYIRLGLGYNNNQSVSFSQANFDGPVTGAFAEFRIKRQIGKVQDINFAIEGILAHRDLKAEELDGERNGLKLSGESTSSISSLDTLITSNLDLSHKTSVGASLGGAYWNLKADASALYSANGVTATARKSIDTKGFDPLVSIFLDHKINGSNLLFKLSNRSLYSKANTSIVSGELFWKFAF